MDNPNYVGPVTPGVKPKYADVTVDAGETLEDIIASLNQISKKSSKVSFSSRVDVHEIVPYAEVLGVHPSRILLSGPVNMSGEIGRYEFVKPHMDPFTGLDSAAMKIRRSEFVSNSNLRSKILP